MVRLAPGVERILDALLRAGPYGLRAGREGLTLEKLRAAPHGIDLGPLEPRARERVRHRQRKVELCPAALAADVPRVERWVEARQGGQGGTLSLIGRRHLRSNNSWMHNLAPLVKGPGRTALLVHPDDAAARGLRDGAEARVRGPGGEVVARVEVTSDVMPGVVSLPHGFGHGAAAESLRVAGALGGPNANAVLGQGEVEPLTGTAVLNGVGVTVEPVGG